MMRLENISKTYGETKAVAGVSLELTPGSTLALLGPSGCGKSTLLRLIAGLERPDEGKIWLDGREITKLPPQKRGFGLVFQDYALFPHLNVEKNIAYGLVEKGWNRDAQRARVEELLALVGLRGYNRRRTHELSGGEQQRVALARALAPKPPLLLLDEPLSNLDLALREELKAQLSGLLRGLEISAVYVTHDQSEAFMLADRIAVMRAGKLEQVDAPGDLFKRPASVWIARFLGHQNIFPTGALAGIAPDAAPFTLIRSDLIGLGTGTFTATLASCRQIGALYVLELDLKRPALRVRWTGFARDLPPRLEIGDGLRLEIPQEALVGLAETP